MNNAPPYGIGCSKGALYLEGNYGVYFGNQLAGKVQVLRQRLYYRFICRCRIRGDVLCRLRVSCGGRQEELGILVPTGDSFGLDKRVPAKYFGEGVPEFHLFAKVEEPEGTFIPIVPEEPFSYITKLKSAYLVRREGQAGIVVY